MLSPRRKFLQFYCSHHHHHQPRRFFLFIFTWTFSSVCVICLIASLGNDKDGGKDSVNDIHYLRNSQENEYYADFHNIWTRISDSIHVYSAHLDTRTLNVPNRQNSNKSSHDNLSLIRVIGLKRVPPIKDIIRENPMKWLRMKDETYYGDKYICKIFAQKVDKSLPFVSFEGDVLTYHIIEEGVKRFSSCYFNCYVNSTLLTKLILEKSQVFVAIYPIHVSGYPDKLIRVESNMLLSQEENLSSNSLAVCVRPFFGPMDDLAKVIQFVSYYHAMGVTSFNFYDLSISPRVRKYLTTNELLRNGQDVISVRLKTWNLPTGNTSELWDYGSLAALNDCLYRNMQNNHVIFVDIDEFVVPQMDKHVNLHDVINFYENMSSSKFHQLRIRNTFFCDEFCQNSKSNVTTRISKKNNDLASVDTSLFPIIRCTSRTKRVWNVNLRSKFIVKPQKIISVGHHLVTKFVEKIDHRFNKNTIEVSPDIALLNHYRECRSISTRKNPVLNRLTVVDRKILKFTFMLRL